MSGISRGKVKNLKVQGGFPQKCVLNPLVFYWNSPLPPQMMILKYPPISLLLRIPNLINMTNMTRHHTQFPLTTSHTKQTSRQSSFSSSRLNKLPHLSFITLTKTYYSVSFANVWLTSRQIWNSPVIKASMYRSPFKILQRKAGFAWYPQPMRHSVQSVFF